MIQVDLNIDTPLYTLQKICEIADAPFETVRTWTKTGIVTFDAPKVGRGKIQKYTILDAMRILLVGYLDYYSPSKETAGQFADFVANRVRGRQKHGLLFGWEESLWLNDWPKNEAGDFHAPADENTMDEELGVFQWGHWGVKADTRADLMREIHREIAAVVRDRPVGFEGDTLRFNEATDEELDQPLTDKDYRTFSLEHGPLMQRIAIVPIGHIVNSIALHLQPEAFEPTGEIR